MKGRTMRRIVVVVSAVAMLSASAILSGCGGGGSALPTGTTLTGSAAVSGSAVANTSRSSTTRLKKFLGVFSQHPSNRTRGRVAHTRQSIQLDPDLGL